MSSDQLEEYESQLADIEELLEADPTDESILKLKSDLVELIALTKEEDDGAEETTTTAAESTTTESAPADEAVPAEAPVAAASIPPPDTNTTTNEPPRKKLKKVKDFEVPAHLQVLETDNEKEVNRKKRALKALKSKHRSKQRDYESTKKQQSWQNFSKKGKKSKNKSIFATQEGSNAKVGVVSGGSMTEFGERKRHKYN